MRTKQHSLVPRWLVLSVATGGFLAGATAATAQIVDIDLAPKEQVPGVVLTPTVGFGVIYDDNAIVASEGNPAPDDSIFSVRPGLDFTLTKKHTVLSAGYFGSLMRYRTLDQFDSFDQGGRFEFRHQPSRRVQLYARDAFSVNPSTDAVLEPGIPFLRTGTRQNTVEGGATVAVTRRLDLSGSYRFQWLEFDRTFRPVDVLLQGGRAHGLTFTARQRVSERVSVGGDFNLQHAVIGGEGPDTSDIQNAQGVVTWQISPTVNIEGGAGLSHVSLGEPFGSSTEPAGRIAIRKQAQYAVFSATAARSFRPSFGAGRSMKNQELSVGVYVPFAARRAFVHGQLVRQQNESVIEDGLRLTANWVHTSVGYALSRWLRIEGFYAGAFQDTNVAGGQVHRNRVGVQVITSAPMRID